MKRDAVGEDVIGARKKLPTNEEFVELREKPDVVRDTLEFNRVKLS